MRLTLRHRVLFSLFSLCLAGCPYGLVNVQDAEKHQQQVDGAISSLRSDLQQLQGRVSGLDQKTQASAQSIKDLQKQHAEFDARFEETGLNMRLLQGSLDKRDHRLQEIAQTVDAHEFRIQELSAAQKGLAERVDGIRGTLASLESRVSGSLGTHEQRLKDLATKVDELSRSLPPLLAEQAVQLKTLSRNLEAYGGRDAGEIDQLGKSLTSLSEALDLLAQRVTSRVDEQGRTIVKISKQLESLEAKLGSDKGKGKRSGEDPGGPLMRLAPLFYQVAQVSWRVGKLRSALDALGDATRSSIREAEEDDVALTLLRRSEALARSGDTTSAWAQLEEVVLRYPMTGASSVARERLSDARALLSGVR